MVNDPAFGQFDTVELIPINMPGMQPYEVSMQESMQFAVQMRPEILQALKQIKAGSIRVWPLLWEAYIAIEYRSYPMTISFRKCLLIEFPYS